MNYENMSLDELKEYAKQLDIKVGNIGKEKLIEKIKVVENNKTAISAVIEDDDLEATDSVPTITQQEEKKESLLDSITSAIDDLDESVDTGINSNIEDLPIDTVIPVKSITFGGLTYKSRTNNSDSLQYMKMLQKSIISNRYLHLIWVQLKELLTLHYRLI